MSALPTFNIKQEKSEQAIWNLFYNGDPKMFFQKNILGRGGTVE